MLFILSRYKELLEQRLKERKEKIARGEPVDDLAMEEIPEDMIDAADGSEDNIDPRTLLEDLQKRYYGQAWTRGVKQAP